VKLQFHTLDVFTGQRFSGNPLAAVMESDGLTDAQMLAITREFNLSETIFIQSAADKANTAKVRIFCPGGEMPFAGHPTLGCAVLLAELKFKPGCSFETEIRLEEVAGLVPVKVARIGEISSGMFTAPVVPFAVKGSLPTPEAAAAALGLVADEIGLEGHHPGIFRGGPTFLYIPVASRKAISAARVIEPHWSEITKAAGVDNTYLYTKGGDDPATSFRARMFAPAAGIYEDPATGSATAILSAQLLGSKALREGTNRFKLEQGYEMGRASELTLEADVKAEKITAIRVGGSAVRVSEGTISV
jgi:trans-2,3-dihydro-3-hydroxyanthranilate isomerase